MPTSGGIQTGQGMAWRNPAGCFGATSYLALHASRHVCAQAQAETGGRCPHGPNQPHAPYNPNDLMTSSHVFVRRDTVRKQLECPYDGPFRVVDRHAKYFRLDINGHNETVSVDRLKPAFIDKTQCTHINSTNCLPLSTGRHSHRASQPHLLKHTISSRKPVVQRTLRFDLPFNHSRAS